MDAPRIDRAVPVRRYAIGPYVATLLNEVETPDAPGYHFIFALVREGRASPSLFIVSQPAGRADAGPDTIIRVIADGGERAFGPDDRWLDLDAFAEDALAMARKALGLEDEVAHRLL